ncbi:hypothetical protein [Streptomyces silvensis]|uniref:Uncharacterized protein n=1 Tax=Streptomyces silvensis TaxID=1765722 RepID=A0A0W7WSX0_9ACTN|nr:hypothetical protein [Streptomyces silvensis]KUF13677.1 hypothetical protein AT728_39290 [Streptomyces silvensis]
MHHHSPTRGGPPHPARSAASERPPHPALSALATLLALPALQSALAPRARRAAAKARSTRFRLERAAAGRDSGREPLLPPPAHLSLRDSRTLNLALAAPEPDPRSAELLITRGHRRFRVPLAVERDTDGGPLLTATVTLHDALDTARTPRTPAPAPLLGDGVWRLTVVTADEGGRVRRRGLTLEAPTAAGAPQGPTTPHAPSPRTGTLMRVVRCRGGRAAVQVTRSPARAELVRFVPRGDGITVHGRVVAGPSQRPVRATRAVRALTALPARAVRRRDGVVVPLELHWEGAAFRCVLPLGAMAGAGPGQWVWDFRVGELPLGRRLTDVRDLPSAFPTPFRLVALPDGRLVRAHPHLTASGAFAVTCLDITKETS